MVWPFEEKRLAERTRARRLMKAKETLREKETCLGWAVRLGGRVLPQPVRDRFQSCKAFQPSSLNASNNVIGPELKRKR